MSSLDSRRSGLARLAGATLAICTLAAGLASQAQAATAGSLDRSFGHNGRVVTDFFHSRDQAMDAGIQGGGRIVVAGRATDPEITRSPLPALARYRRDGHLDRSFGNNGLALLRSWEAGEVDALAIQDDGRIVVAGRSTGGVGWVLARFRQNGKIDRSFGDNGSVHNALPGKNLAIQAKDLAIQSDGKIVAVGVAVDRDGNDYLAIARYGRDGSLDSSFGDEGSVVTQFGQDTYVLGYGVAIQEDGRIVVSGEVGNSWILARFLPDGSLDTGFGNDAGVQHTDPVSVGRALDVAIQPDGKILAAGVDFGGEIGSARFALARYLPDGSPDLSFGEDGAARTAFERGVPSDYANAMALRPDGKIVVAGTARFRFGTPHPARFALARYRADGSLDPSFAGDGKEITGFRPSATRRHRDVGEALAIQANGRIVVAGYTENLGGKDWALARFLGSARR